MEWLTLEYIKQHSRIDYDCEDDILILYGDSAEKTVLNYCNRSIESIYEEYGEVPAPLYQAALMLVDLAYQYRSPISPANAYVIPYTFEVLIKPYMYL